LPSCFLFGLPPRTERLVFVPLGYPKAFSSDGIPSPFHPSPSLSGSVPLHESQKLLSPSATDESSVFPTPFLSPPLPFFSFPIVFRLKLPSPNGSWWIFLVPTFFFFFVLILSLSPLRQVPKKKIFLRCAFRFQLPENIRENLQVRDSLDTFFPFFLSPSSGKNTPFGLVLCFLTFHQPHLQCL